MWTQRRVVVPALVALVVGAVVVSVTMLGGRLGQDGLGASSRPALLDLQGQPEQLGTAVARSSTTSGEPAFELVGDLPPGTPPDASAYSLADGPAEADVVRALAKALGAGTPVRNGTGWRAGGLYVGGESGQAWWFAPCAADTAVSSGVSVGCARTSAVAPARPGRSPSSPPPAPPAMPAETVRAAAKPVFEALQLSPESAVVTTSPYDGTAIIRGVVEGVEVFGWDTNVQVDPDGAIIGAGGWLAAPTQQDRYPLQSAQKTFDSLQAQPRALIAMCPVGPDGQGCVAPSPVKISGARLGLSVQHLRSGEPMLVPSWLFEVADSTSVVAGVAVLPEYLGSDDGQGSGQGSDTPSTKPGVVEPTAGSGGGGTDPGAAREAFRFDQAHPHESGLVVVYGDSGSCPHQGVTHQVKESADSVVVMLEADAMPKDVACTDDYHAITVEVRLQVPLGSRTVIDGSTGKPVAVTKG